MKRIKNITIVFVFLLVPVLWLSAAEKEIASSKNNRDKQGRWSVLGALGGADSGFDQVMVDLGVEYQFSRSLAVQVVANNHFSDRQRYYDPYYYPYGGSFLGYSPGAVSVGMDFNTLHGFTLFGVHKFKLSKKVKFFTKAGLNVTFYSQWDIQPDGYYEKSSKSGLGGAFGAGFDYKLGDKVGLLLGITYKRLIREISNISPDDPSSNLDWFKFYCGIYYRFK